MHGADTPPADPARPTVAVVRAARSQLAAIDPQDAGSAGEIATLLGVTEDLLERAVFEESVPGRRAAAMPRLAPLLGATGDDELADRIAGLDAGGDTLRQAVALLRDTELGPVPSAAPRTPPGSAEGPATSAALLGRYLRSRGETRELAGVTPLAGGYSKETILLTLRGPEGTEDVVLRKVAAGRVADSLADEYGVLRFAAEHGLPVARPLWLDTTGGELGCPLFATSREPGGTVGTVTGPSDAATASNARELARVLGRLHALDISGLGATPRPPMADARQLHAAIDEREKVVQQVADTFPGAPGLALHRALLCWLREHVPASDVPAVLVHGDVGFHNLLVDDGRLSALLDWELAHPGRPAEDLAYVRPSIGSLIGWDEFLALYREAGGCAVDEAELRFFTVWQDVWRAVSCLRLRTKFVLDPARLADGVSGLLLGARFLDSASRTAFGGSE